MNRLLSLLTILTLLLCFSSISLAQGSKSTGTPNHASSWDVNWQENFGGYDNPDPSARVGYRPKAFIPKQNPFYIALPYNDCINHALHKPEAKKVIPWFKRVNPRPGKTT